jgi:hypothetical protein
VLAAVAADRRDRAARPHDTISEALGVREAHQLHDRIRTASAGRVLDRTDELTLPGPDLGSEPGRDRQPVGLGVMREDDLRAQPECRGDCEEPDGAAADHRVDAFRADLRHFRAEESRAEVVAQQQALVVAHAPRDPDQRAVRQRHPDVLRLSAVQTLSFVSPAEQLAVLTA